MTARLKIPAAGELHGRAIAEWIGKTPNTVPPPAVQLRVLLRQSRKDAITGQVIRPGDKTQCDHIKPLKAGGENRESNLQILLDNSHKAKTAADRSDMAKVSRIQAKHLGFRKSKAKWPSRPFAVGFAPNVRQIYEEFDHDT